MITDRVHHHPEEEAAFGRSRIAIDRHEVLHFRGMRGKYGRQLGKLLGSTVYRDGHCTTAGPERRVDDASAVIILCIAKHELGATFTVTCAVNNSQASIAFF